MRRANLQTSRPSRVWKQWLSSPLAVLAGFFAGAALAGGIVAGVLGGTRPQPAVPTRLTPGDSQPDIELLLTPGLLTALVQQSIALGQSPVPLRHAQVTTADGRLTVQGDLDVAGQPVPASVDFQPDIQAGHLVMRATGAHLASIPVPDDIGQLAAGPVNRELAAATNGLPASILSASVAPEGLDLIARIAPSAFQNLPATATPQPARRPATPSS